VSLSKAHEIGHQENLEKLLIILSAFSPHIAEEIWSFLGNKDLACQQEWPGWDEAKCQDETIEIAVQVNGKLRGKVNISAAASEAEVFALAKNLDNVAKYIAGKKVVKKIYVPGRLLSIVVK